MEINLPHSRKSPQFFKYVWEFLFTRINYPKQWTINKSNTQKKKHNGTFFAAIGFPFFSVNFHHHLNYAKVHLGGGGEGRRINLSVHKPRCQFVSISLSIIHYPCIFVCSYSAIIVIYDWGKPTRQYNLDLEIVGVTNYIKQWINLLVNICIIIPRHLNSFSSFSKKTIKIYIHSNIL